MTEDWRNTCITPGTTLRQTLVCLEESAMQIALVLDVSDKLLGVITDGDVRRAILRGLDMNTLAPNFMAPNPQCANTNDSRAMVLNRMRSESLQHMPILTDNGILVDLVLFENKETLPNNVVLMAGGSGIRLRPLTTDVPKPMLQVGNRPILETIIDQLHNFGFKNFHISLNYLGDQIVKYFDDGSQWGISIKYLKEDRPLGTAGALSLLETSSIEPVIVMNSDLLTKLDFKQLLNFHNSHNSSLTVCVRDYNYVLPYGVVEVNGQTLLTIKEKPQKKVLVNAGIYILDNKVLNLIAPDAPMDMTDVIRELINKQDHPSVYPIHEYWIDIGQKQDFQRAEDEFLENF
jgi:dTDP-glucose pyrophosphorylase